MTPRMRLAVRIWPWLRTALVLRPVLGPGYVLSYDTVFVPDLAMRTSSGFVSSLPRAVPSDAVVAVLDEIVPGMLLQKLVLVGAPVLDAGLAGAPEDIIWRDHVLQVLGLIWLVLVTIGVMHV